MTRGIDKGSGKAESTLLHGGRDQRFHLLQLSRGRRPIDVAEHRLPDLRGPHVGAQVGGGAGFFQTAEIAHEVLPVDGEVVVVQNDFLRRYRELVLRSDGAAFPGDFAGDALRQFALGTVVDQQGQFRLAQLIDEAWTHHHAGGIDLALGPGVLERSNGYDAIATDRNVSPVWRASRAVDDLAMANEDV